MRANWRNWIQPQYKAAAKCASVATLCMPRSWEMGEDFMNHSPPLLFSSKTKMMETAIVTVQNYWEKKIQGWLEGRKMAWQLLKNTHIHTQTHTYTHKQTHTEILYYQNKNVVQSKQKLIHNYNLCPDCTLTENLFHVLVVLHMCM